MPIEKASRPKMLKVKQNKISMKVLFILLALDYIKRHNKTASA